MPSWHEADYRILRTYHFCLLSSSSPIPHRQIIHTPPPQPDPSGSKSSRLAGAMSIKSLIGTQQKRRHQLVYCNAANAATKDITQDAHLTIVSKTGSSTNMKQCAVGCEYIHTVVNSRQLGVYAPVGVHRALRDQFIAAHNRKPPWSSKSFVRTAPEIKHHDVVSYVVFAEKFPNKHPREWPKQASITLEEDTEAYMVEVIAASHCLKQQQIPFRYSTCQL